MQKKILAAVLSLLLVGSASSAFAGGYWSSTDIDIKDSFKDQSDDDVLDLDVKNSGNRNDNDGYDIDIKDSFKESYDIDVTEKKNLKVNAQGNLVSGKFVVQQFGGSAGGAGGAVMTVDNSINHSTINSYNDTNSHNRTYTSNHSFTSNKDINNSYNRTRTSSHKTDIDVDVHIDKSQSFKAVNSFNRNRLGGLRQLPN